MPTERTLNDLRRVFQYAFEASIALSITFDRSQSVSMGRSGSVRLKSSLRFAPWPDDDEWFGVSPRGTKYLAYFTDCKKVTKEAEEAGAWC